MSATLTVDRKKYVRLDNCIVVKAIDSEEEFDQMVAAVEDLLTSLPPNEMLAYLMETSGKTIKDLLPVFGSRGRISEVLNAKRATSKERSKRPAVLFRVSTDLFI